MNQNQLLGEEQQHKSCVIEIFQCTTFLKSRKINEINQENYEQNLQMIKQNIQKDKDDPEFIEQINQILQTFNLYTVEDTRKYAEAQIEQLISLGEESENQTQTIVAIKKLITLQAYLRLCEEPLQEQSPQQIREYVEKILKQFKLKQIQQLQKLIEKNKESNQKRLKLLKKGKSSQKITKDVQKIILQFEKHLSYIEKFKNLNKKLYKVSFEGKVQQFPDGYQLSKVIKKMTKNKGKYLFYQEKNQYLSDSIKSDLQIIEVEIANVFFGSNVLKNAQIPCNIQISDIPKYLNLSSILEESLENIFVYKIKTNQREYTRNQFQGKCINDLNLVGYTLILSYMIQLEIQIILSQSSWDTTFEICASDQLHKIKKEFQEKCKIQDQLQCWQFEDEQILNDDTFIGKKFFTNNLSLKVKQIQNLEYYGFSRIEEIKLDTFINFTIENDEKFKKDLIKGNFPQETFQSTFRIYCIGIIFSAIKKHCLIQSSIKHIEQLVRETNFKNALKNQLKYKLWKATYKNTSYFNPIFILHNLLISCQKKARIQLMRCYKNSSPLFLNAYNQKGEKNFFKQEHFWVSTKSFVVTSLQYKQKVRGKSKLLNYIFGLDIPLQENRHPNCSKSVMINYNIYRNEDHLVDLIDISSDGVSDSQLKALCKKSNLLIIHTTQKNYQQCQSWVKKEFRETTVIFIKRDSNSSMDNSQKFNNQLQQNSKNDFESKFKKYTIPTLNEKNFKYYDHYFQKIIDQINTIVIQESKRKETDLNKFSTYLAINKQSLSLLTIMEQIEKNFSNLDIQEQRLNENRGEILLPKILNNLIEEFQTQTITQFMNKMRQSIRIIRNRRMKQFFPISKLLKLVQVKDQKKISQNQQDIKKNLFSLGRIPTNQVNSEFSKIVKQLISIEKITQQAIKIQTKVKELNSIYIQKIKPKQFSVENFWRTLGKFFQSNLESTQKNEKIKDKIRMIFQHEFCHGKTFQVVNGDNLQIPIGLLKSIQLIIENKKVMVVGIFGPQSSGKSTLLNYLFGCDFASSDGRCTNGIYGTYYEIENGSYPFRGILVLDTEGLFSNYKRKFTKGENFDNKLVLFLLKTCDILILNTRGDIDKNCENILQVSFDCQLMKHKKGIVYPNFYIILNQSVQKINEQQQIQVRNLRQKIIDVNTYMQKYISTNETNSMPIAFINSSYSINSKVLKGYKKKSKLPTDQFYRSTKELSIKIIQILYQRHSHNQAKFLPGIYDSMNAVWNGIINSPLLTMHSSKILKEYDQNVNKFILLKKAVAQKQIEGLLLSMPEKSFQFEKFQAEKTEKFSQILEDTRSIIKNQFPERADYEKNSIVKRQIQSLSSHLQNLFHSIKIKMKEKKIQIQINQNKRRGVDAVMKVARKLKKEWYKNNIKLEQEQIKRSFDHAWENHIKLITDSFKIQVISKRIQQQIKQLYKSNLKSYDYKFKTQTQGQKLNQIFFNNKKSYPINEKKNWKEYFQSILAECNKQLVNFYHCYSSLNISPIIVLDNNPSSLSYQYLNMKKFFQWQKKTNQIYVDLTNSNKFVNEKNLQQKLISYLTQENKIKQISLNLIEDLKQFKIFLKTASEKNILEFVSTVFFFMYKKLEVEQSWQIKLVQQFPLQKYFSYDFKTNKQQIEQLITQKKQDLKFIQPNTLFEMFQNQFLIKRCKILKFWNPQLTFKASIRLGFSFNFQKCKQQLKEIIKKIEKKLIKNISTSLASIGFYIDSENSKFLYTDSIQENSTDQQIPSFKSLPPAISIHSIFLILQEKPIEYLSYSDFCTKLSKIQNVIQVKYFKEYHKKNSKYYLIGKYDSLRLKVKQQYETHKYLNSYKEKNYSDLQTGDSNFLKFIFQYIQKDLIFQKIYNFLSLQNENKKIEIIIQNLLGLISRQLYQFNNDLKQIAYQLHFKFISVIHQFSCALLTQKMFLKQTNQIKQKKKSLEKDREDQRKIFFNLFNSSILQLSVANAKIFIQKYSQFISEKLTKIKNQFVVCLKNKFLNNFKRKEFQKQIDYEMIDCKDQNIAYSYLVNPKQFLKQKYENFVNQFIKQQFKNWSPKQIQQAIKEMKMKFKKMYQQLEGQTENYQASQIFNSFQGQQTASQKLAQIFLQLLCQEKDIDQKYQNNKFNLKNICFKNLLYMETQENKRFLDSGFDIEIEYFKEFISQLNQQLNLMKIDLQLKDKQQQQLKNEIQIRFCLHDCPFCGRLCDIDIREYSGGHIHQCSSGHQMRALKGIIIQTNKQNNKKSYASIKRCDQIQDSTLMEYDGNTLMWMKHKQNMPNWRFESSDLQPFQKLMFENLWSLAGQKICQEIKQKLGINFEFLRFSDYDNTIKSGGFSANHYIFSIDGSGSMKFMYNKWDIQLSQLHDILIQISSNPLNRVSIIIFTDDPLIIHQKQIPKNIYPKSFHFPSGATDKEAIAAFKGAIKVMQKNLDLNTHFIYLSDGHGLFPQNQIKTMLHYKKYLEDKNYIFTYTSILIGEDAKGRQKMDLINKQMKGSSKWGQANQIFYHFKEIYCQRK